MRRTTRWLTAAVWMATGICWLAAKPARGAEGALQAGLKELEQVRQTLRERLRERARADAAVEVPRDLRLDIDAGLGRGRMRLLLRRQGGTWHVRRVDGAPAALEPVTVDTSGLRWEADRIAGPLVLKWSADGEPGGDGAQADEAEEEGPPAGAGLAQTFRLDARVQAAEPRLVLTLHRFQGGDWRLAYKRQGGKWALDEQLETPLPRWGPFETKFSALEPDADGRFEARIELVYKGDREASAKAYAQKQPVVTFAGRLVGERVDADWLLEAPGGKGLLGSGQDMLTGALETGVVAGRYRSDGAKGAWTGRIDGSVTAADPTAMEAPAEPTPPPADDPAATIRAAQVYRDVLALDMALRRYPMPLSDALSRTLVPEPAWPQGAAAEAMREYVDGLARHAKQALVPPAEEQAPVRLDDETFGPFFGQACLADAAAGNPVPQVQDGPQEWRAVTGWRMVGPFPVVDQEAPVLRPEVLPVAGAAYRRTRLFADPSGEVAEADDAVAWMDARQDRATVAAPQRPEASAAAMRYLAWYATAELQSAAEQTVWLAMRLQGQALVWIDGDLAWQSGTSYDSPHPAVFRVRLRQGTNRVLVRCASNRASNVHCDRVDWFDGHPGRPMGRIDFTTFAMYVATRGGPGFATAQPGFARAEPGRPQPTTRAVAPPPDSPLGYRRDGSGVYPDAEPPLAWDLKAGTNVAWQRPLPMGVADPVVRDGRVFVTAEPSTLFALDAASGEVLWRKDVEVPEGAPGAKPPAKKGLTASVTPVVTADRIFVHFGTGLAACYGPQGEEKWRVATGAPWGHSNMGSPVLVDGRLVLQAHLPGGPDGAFGLIALDARTGERLWTARGPEKRVHTRHDRAFGLGNGLAVMRLASGDAARSLLITGDGAVIDAADGRLLHRDIFVKEAHRAAPCVVGDTVYATPVMGEEAVRLWLDEAGRVGARTLWANPPQYGRGQVKTVTDWGERHWMKGPVVHEGLLYVWRVDKAHVPQHYPCPFGQLEVFDARTGARLTRYRQITREGTDPTVAPVIAGRYLFVGDGGDPVPGFHGTTEYGQLNPMELLGLAPEARAETAVYTPRTQGLLGIACLAARNRTGKMRASPVFDGRRLFLRHYDGLVCIASDPKQKAFEVAAMADVTINELVGRQPKPLNVLDVKAETEPGFATAQPGFARAEPGDLAKTAVSPLVPRRVPAEWLVLGPLAQADDADGWREALAGPAGARPEEGRTVTVGEAKATLRRLGPEARTQDGHIDALAAVGGKSETVGYYCTLLESTRRQDLVFLPQGPAIEAWLAGRPLEKGAVVRFEIGYYPLLLRCRLGRQPPFIRSVPLVPAFFPSPAADMTPEEWRRRIVLFKGRLERIAGAGAETEWPSRARMLLDGLAGGQ